MREKKGVIFEFENWGGGKVLMMVERSGSAARRWLSAVAISFCDVNGFGIVGVRRGKCGFFTSSLVLMVGFRIFLAGKVIFEEIKVLTIGGCGLVMGVGLDLI